MREAANLKNAELDKRRRRRTGGNERPRRETSRDATVVSQSIAKDLMLVLLSQLKTRSRYARKLEADKKDLEKRLSVALALSANSTTR